MNTTTVKTTGAALATAAAMLFAFAPLTTVQAADAQVACMGINACKGQGSCKTANNACKGRNACKGQGFVNTTKEECDAKGGKVMEMK